MSRASRSLLDICTNFILERFISHQSKSRNTVNEPLPFFVGINGVQGCGKTTLVAGLAQRLRGAPHNIETLVVSIDDFYLTRPQQAELADQNPGNALVQHRGQPSTHDVLLATSFFSSLRDRKPTRLPSYDKSAFKGLGNQVAEDQWQMVNAEGEAPVRLIIFEGWCVGFNALSDPEVKERWETAVVKRRQGQYTGRLGFNDLESVMFINQALRAYRQITDYLNILVHLDAADLLLVYRWRAQQEDDLRKAKGTGMSDQQVKDFVDGYYPAYELYTDALRTGALGNGAQQLRVVIDAQRNVESVHLV